MKFNFTGVFIGSEDRTSSKTGEVFHILGFLNGIDTMQLSCPASIDYQHLEMYKPYNVEVEYLTAFKNFRLTGVNPLKG